MARSARVLILIGLPLGTEMTISRKIHFLVRARAVAIFPGGFGTLDEFFETLTLIQTRRMEPIPLLMFGKSFWGRVINLQALEEEGTISPGDTNLFHMVDTAEEGWDIVREFYNLPEIGIGKHSAE